MPERIPRIQRVDEPDWDYLQSEMRRHDADMRVQLAVVMLGYVLFAAGIVLVLMST